MTMTDEELIAWNGDGFPPAIEAIRQRIDQLPAGRASAYYRAGGRSWFASTNGFARLIPGTN